MTIPAVEQPPVQEELSVMDAAANMALLATTTNLSVPDLRCAFLPAPALYQCSRCSDSYSEPIPAPGHDMEEVVYTKATCTKEGLIAHLCRNNCGYFYTERIDATGHDWYSNWITDENNHWHKCNVCNEKKDDFRAHLG